MTLKNRLIKLLPMICILAIISCKQSEQDSKTISKEQKDHIDKAKKKHEKKRYEDSKGVTRVLPDFKPYTEIEGKAYESEGACCESATGSSKLEAYFETAKVGSYIYGSQGLHHSFYVNIHMIQSDCCQKTRILQVVSNPPNWSIDSRTKNAFPDHPLNEHSTIGEEGYPAVVRDIPARRGEASFIARSILFCFDGAPKPIGYVEWGFDVVKSGTTHKVNPKSPVVKCGPPDGLKEAIEKWNLIANGSDLKDPIPDLGL